MEGSDYNGKLTLGRRLFEGGFEGVRERTYLDPRSNRVYTADSCSVFDDLQLIEFIFDEGGGIITLRFQDCIDFSELG